MTSHERVPDGALAIIEFVRALPFGRPAGRTTAAMLAERRGTCSTKHGFLHDVLSAHFPELEPRLIHRVYRVHAEQAAALFDPGAATVVPPGGIVDVHRYLEIGVGGVRIHVDATFPGLPWDGSSSMSLACGAGTDHPVTGDPDEEKRALESRHCDPEVREPFIAALTAMRR